MTWLCRIKHVGSAMQSNNCKLSLCGDCLRRLEMDTQYGTGVVRASTRDNWLKLQLRLRLLLLEHGFGDKASLDLAGGSLGHDIGEENLLR
jgi:hypothetical protein